MVEHELVHNFERWSLHCAGADVLIDVGPSSRQNGNVVSPTVHSIAQEIVSHRNQFEKAALLLAR